MLDDVPDKARRNLVVYCGLILIGLYLGIDLNAISSVPGVNIDKLDPLKTTVVSIVILMYLLLRFSFTADYKNSGAYLDAWYNIPESAVFKRVEAATAQFKKYGRKAKACNIFDWSLFDGLATKMLGEDYPENFGIRLDDSRVEVFRGSMTGTINAEVFDRRDMDAILRGRPVFLGVLEYKLHWFLVIRQRMASLWWPIANSEDFLTVKFPMAASFVTYVYLLSRLVIIINERLH